jgi:hypothetical protein
MAAGSFSEVLEMESMQFHFFSSHRDHLFLDYSGCDSQIMRKEHG